jgi:NAD-dependent SIR2 family protein deacetylase
MALVQNEAIADPLTPLVELLRDRRVAVLTGAGISTESGIPDYRGPETRRKARNPIQHRAFVGQHLWRARYWARSAIGWPRFRNFEPNLAHAAVARLEATGRVTGLITQNVDRLHHKAGSRNVIELHGTLYDVRCLECGELEARDSLQLRLLEQNPDVERWPFALAPDGDADIPDEVIEGFRVPGCLRCEGVLKPDVVFFGDNVPAARVEQAFRWVDEAEALLVVGSSLAVWSGYRFVVRAAERKLPIAIVNLGESRGDPHATLRLDARAGEVLPALLERLAEG